MFFYNLHFFRFSNCSFLGSYVSLKMIVARFVFLYCYGLLSVPVSFLALFYRELSSLHANVASAYSYPFLRDLINLTPSFMFVYL